MTAPTAAGDGRLQERVLVLRPAGPPGRFHVALPAGFAGRWCRLTLSLPDAADGPARWWAKLEATDLARGQVVREAFLGRARRSRGRLRRATLVHVPDAADGLTVQVFAEGPCPQPAATLRVLTRPCAALALLAHGWRALPAAVAGDRPGLPGRVRTMLGQAPARDGEAPPYALWIVLYDRWQRPDRAVLARLAGIPIAVVVVGADQGACRATLASLRSQWVTPAQTIVIAGPRDWVAADSRWVLVLQAGETLAPQALACFATQARADTLAEGFYADSDSIAAGKRTRPLLKPRVDPWLLRSGLLTRGACLFRAQAMRPHDSADAESWRRLLAEALPPGTFTHIPFILTHLVAVPRVATNVAVVAGGAPSVSIVIPTSGRRDHMLHCLRRLVGQTAYPTLEVLLAVSTVDAADAAQSANLAAACRLPAVRVLDLGMATFNYAAVNNAAVRHASGELVLLLNDDVVPLSPDWLQRMVAFLTGPPALRADIVGPRLLYGNGRVQHGGVILGLANLCEHAFRLATRDDPGPHGLAGLNRQVSAVTAACMLLRRSLYETLGGMDEAFAVALNDVDFCLRAGRGGARIVFAAELELMHYESLSLGRHYEGGRAGLEAVEVRRLRDRWSSVIDDDPFYSQSASLQPGREFHPGFPSRTPPFSWSGGEAPVQD